MLIPGQILARLETVELGLPQLFEDWCNFKVPPGLNDLVFHCVVQRTIKLQVTGIVVVDGFDR